MTTEYGGARSIGTYLRNKEKRTPKSYQKKYNVEIEESVNSCFSNSNLIFKNCNFYIDDLISLSTIRNSNSNANTPLKEWNYPRVKKEYISDEENNQQNCSTYWMQTKDVVDSLFTNDDNNTNNNNDKEYNDMLNATPVKTEYYYDDGNALCNGPTVSKVGYSTNEPLGFKDITSVQNSYINKKENLEILIVQNGGKIYNMLLGDVTHIISNNMALGNKKYADFKKRIKKSKTFIVEDTYVFDCVKSNSRLCEQLYLPKTLRYNSRQITEFFPFNEKKKKSHVNTNKEEKNTSHNKETSKEEKNIVQPLQECHQTKSYDEHNSNDVHSNPNGEKGNHLVTRENKDSEKYVHNTQGEWKESKETKEMKLNEKMEALLMGMSYDMLKKFVINDCNSYFLRLYKYYCNKERTETVFCVSSDLYLNTENFEEFGRKTKILNYLTEEEITWIKTKSKLNLKMRNVWENDFIHFFFNMVLKRKPEVPQKKKSFSAGNNMKDEEISDKLIDSVSGYFNNSRLYILGNWQYITKALFDFSDIQLKTDKKCVYIYIDFDYYFLNASIHKSNIGGKNWVTSFDEKNINNSIFCVCHSTKKEDSFGMISSINYWAAKNKIYKGMLKMDATRILHNNIHFVRYDFPNILKCSFLLLLVLMNYSQNVKVCSVDESILQLFYSDEEEIFVTAKRISNDIYNLTKLNVTVGISDSFEVARHALKFCKKRFLFFDFYHHFCIFLRQYMDWRKDRLQQKLQKKEQKKKREEDRKKRLEKSTAKEKMENAVEKKDENLSEKEEKDKTEEKDKEEKDKTEEKDKKENEHGTEKMNDSLTKEKETNEMINEKEDSVNVEQLVFIENLFDIYLKFEEKKRNRDIEDEKIQIEQNRIDAAFLTHVNQKDEEVLSVFDKFMNMHKKNLETIMNTFFDKVIHPISKYFFFYLKNDFYFEILKKYNYMNGMFIDFNIYYLKEKDLSKWVIENRKDNVNSDICCAADNSNAINTISVTDSGNDGKKKIVDNNIIPADENLNETKSISIRANYGIRFNKINDLYYLIYFMTKQLYLKLKIKNSKARHLSMNFFLRDENENINPAKYLGRGKVINLKSQIKLNHHTDSFFAYFFKIIFKFQFIMHKLEDLRGVQLTCSDIIKDAPNMKKKSILYYFKDTAKGKNMNDMFLKNKENIQSSLKDITLQDVKNKNHVVLPKDNSANEEKVLCEKENIVKTEKMGKIEEQQEEEHQANSGSNNSSISSNNHNNMNIVVEKLEKKKKRKRKRKESIIEENEEIHEKKITDYIRGFNSEKTSNTHDSANIKRKRKSNGIGDNVKNILSYFVENVKEIETKNNLINKLKIVKRTTKQKNVKSSANSFLIFTKPNKTSATAKSMRNYKILDFYPNIIVKKQTIISATSIVKNPIEKKTIEHINMFDSIINIRIKVKNEIDANLLMEEQEKKKKEKETKVSNETDKNNEKTKKMTCYKIFIKAYNDIKEKQNNHDANMTASLDCVNQSICYICICNRLYVINQMNQNTFDFYLYVKKIFNIYIFYFMNALENHKCDTVDDDINRDVDMNTDVNTVSHVTNSDNESVLYKFLLYILNDICEILHQKRFLDVLHKFLINFKWFWNIQNKNTFPQLLQSILNKYMGVQEE